MAQPDSIGGVYDELITAAEAANEIMAKSERTKDVDTEVVSDSEKGYLQNCEWTCFACMLH